MKEWECKKQITSCIIRRIMISCTPWQGFRDSKGTMDLILKTDGSSFVLVIKGLTKMEPMRKTLPSPELLWIFKCCLYQCSNSPTDHKKFTKNISYQSTHIIGGGKAQKLNKGGKIFTKNRS